MCQPLSTISKGKKTREPKKKTDNKLVNRTDQMADAILSKNLGNIFFSLKNASGNNEWDRRGKPPVDGTSIRLRNFLECYRIRMV